jgi:transcription elongation factor Elf1
MSSLQEEHFFTCPYCWQKISFVLDLSVSSQSYVEDCEVCCNPINVSFSVDEDGELEDFAAEPIG